MFHGFDDLAHVEDSFLKREVRCVSFVVPRFFAPSTRVITIGVPLLRIHHLLERRGCSQNQPDLLSVVGCETSYVKTWPQTFY